MLTGVYIHCRRLHIYYCMIYYIYIVHLMWCIYYNSLYTIYIHCSLYSIHCTTYIVRRTTYIVFQCITHLLYFILYTIILYTTLIKYTIYIYIYIYIYYLWIYIKHYIMNTENCTISCLDVYKHTRICVCLSCVVSFVY